MTIRRYLFALLASSAAAGPATASPARPAMYASSYVDGFIEFWTGAFQRTDGIVLFAVGIAVVCISIILFGGKWKK